MRPDKLRRRLAVGLLAIAAGVGVIGGAATATSDEFDWGSAPTVVNVDGTTHADLPTPLQSLEFDWG
jgi:hypothetical protein